MSGRVVTEVFQNAPYGASCRKELINVRIRVGLGRLRVRGTRCQQLCSYGNQWMWAIVVILSQDFASVGRPTLGMPRDGL